MLRRVFINGVVEIKTELDFGSSLSVFQSAYYLNNNYPYATLGRVQTY